MAFEKLHERPPRGAFLTSEDLMGVSDRQFAEEVAYWEGVKAGRGFFQLEFAGDFMLGCVLPIMRDFREAAGELRQLRQAHGAPLEMGRLTRRKGAQAIAGLALGRLVRSHAYSAYAAEGNVALHQHTLGVDADMDAPRPLVFLHDRQERVAGILPDYDPQAPGGWWAEDSLVVNTVTPARPTAVFRQGFAGVGGAEFDPSEYTTLRPQLLKTYIQPPSA